ncbi:sugar ABC transporter substrate-binding protein [Pelagibius sp. CAU 1746]|uniref:ABC transporter substrate-binding protein n=1 Tax=Pelagibius sp. CAU 1746 TaxID=3140370 RepID=UPI00325B47D8
MNRKAKYLLGSFAIGCLLTATASASEAAELNIIIEEVPEYDIVRELSKEFTKAHPDITITFDAMPFDAMRDKILTSSLAPSAVYDVIIVDNPWMQQFARAGYLEELDGRIAESQGYDFEDFIEPIRNVGVVDGKIYGVPYYNYALGLIVRQDIFDEKGLTVPSNLEDYVSVVKELTTDGMAGVAMQPQRGYKIMEEWKNWLYATGGEVTDESGNVTIDSPEAAQALNLYIETYKAAAPEGSLNWGFDEALRAVASGRAATMLSYNWMLPTLNKKDGIAGDLAGKFKLYEVPGGKAVLGAWHWSVTANSEQKDAAWQFVSWITSKQVDKQRVIAGGAPMRTSVVSDPEVWEQGFGEEYYKTVLSILEDAAPLATGNSAEEVIEIVGTELSAAVSEQKSVEDALKDAARRVERAQ